MEHGERLYHFDTGIFQDIYNGNQPYPKHVIKKYREQGHGETLRNYDTS